VCFLYVQFYVGWKNYFFLLPNEIVISFLGFLAPIALVVVVALFFVLATKLDVLAGAVNGHETAMQSISEAFAEARGETTKSHEAFQGISEKITKMADETRKSHEAVLSGVAGTEQHASAVSEALARQESEINRLGG
jgi:hypothetical protein